LGRIKIFGLIPDGGENIYRTDKISINNIHIYCKEHLAMFLLILFCLLVIFSYGLGNVSAASGDTIYVNGNSSLGNDDWDGQSAVYTSGTNGPKYSIKNATRTVNVNGTVNIAEGKYTGDRNTKIIINKNMSIVGQSKTDTIINGTDNNWIFYINNGIFVTITNLTLTKGTESYGGAIYNNGGNLNVKNCSFINNTALTGHGGAIYNNEGILMIKTSSFTGNAAYSGGAIYLNDGGLNVEECTFNNNSAHYGGSIYNTGTLIITNCTFTDNNAVNCGGAIYYSGGYLTVTNCKFTNSTATKNGGAIWIFKYISAGHFEVSNCNFTDNTAFYGGAIHNYGEFVENLGTLTINSSTFNGNKANGGGGAICNWGTLNVINSTFTSNTAPFGGAINYNGGILTITSSTFKENIANNNIGGAIYNDNGNLTVIGCNLTDNQADNGGGIYNKGVLTLTDSNLSYNNGGIYNFGTANVHLNRIVGNMGTSIINNINGIMNASLNWWGSNQGPSTSDIKGTTVNLWLVLNIKANPTRINNLRHSNIMIDLLHDNLGNLVDFNGADGIIPIFKTTLGTITQSMISNGTAGSVLTSGGIDGIADVSAQVDSQTVDTFVTIDNIQPTIKNITPANNAINIPSNQVIKVTFSEPINIGNMNIELKNVNGTVIPVTTSISGNILTINHKTLLNNGKYTLILHTGSITDLAGNSLALCGSSFTVDSIPPKIISTNPINNSINVSKNIIIAIIFSENIKTSTYFNNIVIKNLSTNQNLSLSRTISGNTLYIKTSTKSANTVYQVTIPKWAIKDYAGNNLTANYTFRFKTGA
jgi:predicted outer membrane repeat protein